MAVTQLIRIPNINGDKTAFNDDTQFLFETQFPTMISQINNDIALLNNNSTTGTSVTSTTVGTGSKSFTASTGKSWTINSSVRIYSTASAGIWMDGYVTAYNSSTGVLTVMVTNKSGSGTLASWGIVLVPSQVGSDIFLSGTGGRFSADFSNATINSRFIFQTSTTNGNSTVHNIPNGTGTTATWQVHNSSDTINHHSYMFGIDGTSAYFDSISRGSAGTANPIQLKISSTVYATLDNAGNFTLSTGQLGYSIGAGSSVTQLTSKTTGVTINKATGVITMNAAALANGASASFIVTNSLVGVNSVVVANLQSFSIDNYDLFVGFTAAGSFRLKVRNVSGGSLSEAVQIQFAIFAGQQA